MVSAVLLLTMMMQVNGSGTLTPSRIVGTRYPALALQARIQATVRFEVTTDEVGNVASVTTLSENLLNRDRDCLFADSVVESLKRWKFHVNPDGERKTVITYIFKFEGVTSGKRIEGFVFDYPGTVTVTSEVPCPDHVPCPDDRLRKQK